MNEEKRVVITGLGVVCAAGANAAEFRNTIYSGVCCITKVENFDTSNYHAHIAGELKDFKPFLKLKNVKRKYVGRTTSLLLKAGWEAVGNARLNLREFDSDRIGVVLGSSLGEIKQGGEIYEYWTSRIKKRIPTSYLITFPIYKPLDIFALELGVTGPKSLISTACASGTNSIGYAYDLIQRDKADIMIAGGVDPLSKLSYAGFDGLMSLSTEPCAPFSRQSGLSLGEGAGIVILERLDFALKRNAPIVAEFLGYGLSGDAYHSTAPDPSGSGPARAIKFALDEASVPPEKIDYINAHGTGTRFNDPTETKAIKITLGDHAYKTPVSSIKSMIGHTLGAAGAIECIATILTIHDDIIPPTVNFDKPSEECDLDYVPNKAREKEVGIALSNSFGFGGNNAVLVVSKFSKRNSSLHRYPGSRIVVTGMGIVNPVGIGIETFRDNLFAGKSGLKEITSFDTSGYDSKMGGELSDFHPRDFIHFSRLRRMDRLSQMAVVSARLAIEDAGISITNENCERVGIVFGTGTGPMDSIIGSIVDVYEEADKKRLTTVSPAKFLNTVFNAAAGHVSIEFKIKGINSTIAMGGAASSNAICYAFDLLKKGSADAIMAVGADEIGEPLFAGYSILGVLARREGTAEEESRPFDKKRNGFIISEGSGTIVMETLEHAEKRGAKIYGEIAGYGMTSDAHSFFDNDTEGVQLGRAIRIALDEAAVPLSNVDLILSNANSSRRRDISESNGIRKAFGKAAYSIPVSAVKSMTGEPDGGGGINAAIAGLLAMRDSEIPPTINYIDRDELCDLDYVAQSGRKKNINHFLVNACSYGGSNISILFKRYC